MRRTIALAAAVTALGVMGLPADAHNSGLPPVPLANLNLTHHNNVPNLVGNSMAFFERKEADGTLRRYVVGATHGNGFDIIDITDPHEPVTRGRYLQGDGTGPSTVQNSSLGVNWHAWVDVNPRRNIVAVSVEDIPFVGPTGTVRHGGGFGIQLVDISDVANPVPLGKCDGISGPHTIRMIGDRYIYTSLNTYFIDYANPMDPICQSRFDRRLHEAYEDPNHPNRTYVGTAQAGVAQVWDTSDPWNPQTIGEIRDPGSFYAAHEVYPSPDSSYVGVADFTSDAQTQTECPGGAITFYDISGKYIPGASLSEPREMGSYWAPFEGAGVTVPVPPAGTNNPKQVNYGSCTIHSWQMNLEREIALGGLYMGGTWVIDPTAATPAGAGEYDGRRGKTTWGKTIGYNRDALDYVNATQWYPFDTNDPELEKQVFVMGSERGLDIYTYTGTSWPKKMARLRMDATGGPAGAGGLITGKLDRYAVLTYEGYKNFPLAGKTLDVSAGGSTVTVTTDADGSFSADLGLAAGVYQVTATWTGDDVYRGETTTRTVVIP